jgi:glyoxylase-like metal-dependent hydrolase (beta-lactamase superfamily II)
MALTSPMLSRGPFNVSRWLHVLPADGAVPGMPGWRWIHTPGHTPGHVSFWRDSDKTLLAGDAVITTKQESAYAVITQRPELHGPPAYFTTDWDAARESARRLANLQPELLVTGHGRALAGEEMRVALETLARDFDRVARPEHGRYVERPTDRAADRATERQDPTRPQA